MNKFSQLLLLPLALCILLTGCSTFSDRGKIAALEEENAKVSAVSNPPLVTSELKEKNKAQSRAFLEYLSLTQKSETLPKELIAFIKSNRGAFEKEEMTAAANDCAAKVDNYYNIQLEKFNELQGSKDDLYDLTKVSYSSANRVENEPIADDEAVYLNELIDNGLMFYFAEGLVLDYDAQAFLTLFGNDAKGEGVDFMRIVLSEQKQPSMLEGMVQIEKKDMVARYEAVLAFISNYPDSVLLKRCEPMRIGYLKSILVQDWALFDYETGEVRGENRSVLNEYAEAAKGTSIEPLLSEFTAMLEKEGFKKTEAITKFLSANGIFEFE